MTRVYVGKDVKWVVTCKISSKPKKTQIFKYKNYELQPYLVIFYVLIIFLGDSDQRRWKTEIEEKANPTYFWQVLVFENM